MFSVNTEDRNRKISKNLTVFSVNLCEVPRRASYGVYISQLIRFARVCNHVADFSARNKCLTVKLLQQGYRYHKLRFDKHFLNFIVDTMN